MTPGTAAVISVMKRYLVPGYLYRLSMVEVEKLAYFLRVAGEPLGLAENLRGALRDFVREQSDTPDAPLVLTEDAVAEAHAVLANHADTQTRLANVASLIEGFETPFGMELLSTVHWVAKHDEDAARSDEAAVTAVHAWSDRKATTMKPEHVRAAWSHLRTKGWL